MIFVSRYLNYKSWPSKKSQKLEIKKFYLWTLYKMLLTKAGNRLK